MPMDTGFPSSDAQFDYSRARRRHTLSRLGRRLRGQPGHVDLILPFDEVVETLASRGEVSRRATTARRPHPHTSAVPASRESASSSCKSTPPCTAAKWT